jgi:FHS family L-fucose permease-like MFS transporter
LTAAFISRRYHYKTGVLTGLGLSASGAFLFYPASLVMTWALGYVRPARLLMAMALIGTVLCGCAILYSDISGVWAIVMVSASLSLMFPTIYGIALHGLGEDTKFGAAGLVMAIPGGALMPLVQGALIDRFGTATSYITPAACFLVVAAYGWFDLASAPLKGIVHP